MKKALIISGMVLLILLIAAGSFWGGMNYESSRAERARANFTNARGPGSLGTFPPAGQIPGGEIPSGVQGVGGTMGQVKEVGKNEITISTAEDITTVQLTDETQIWKSVTVDIAELQPGMRVRVTGERDNGGEFTAEQITILSDESPAEVLGNPAESPQIETEP